MALDTHYEYVIVESFVPVETTGLHGAIHIRPAADQKYPQTIHVECSKKLSRDYPVGTRFKIRAKLTDREGGGQYLYSSYRWPVEVLPGR
ncbi:hypothetical protein SAMN02787142_3738 [Burkholderia sp. WP9]|uniref:hypothetical protein n=1 Tax=Burkholderia sp. WP9 TaxID=1500263 RepID=UPI0008951A02|nr:hypothetical protein [Burkholderia sp. WP9]SED74260.1 hypothetical protein SAMN02787142_3738 [Burkholderia sp. WP9]